MKERVSLKKTASAMILAVIVLVLAQLIASFLGNSLVSLGLPVWCGNVCYALVTVTITLASVAFFGKKLLGASAKECKLGRPFVRPLWILSAFVMPALVIGLLLLTPGHWENAATGQNVVTWKQAVDYLCFGFAVGITEEAAFRGLIMTAVEMRWGLRVAIWVPSILFGSLHIIGRNMNFLSMVQVIVAGGMVSVLFSLVTYESGSIYSSAWMHGIWDIFMVAGVPHVGIAADSQAIYNYVLDTESFLITGGDFGVEASLPAVAVYGAFAALAWYWCGRD